MSKRGLSHNQLRDLTDHLLTERCHDVKTKPDLQPLTGETLSHTSANSSDGARLDRAMNDFWGGAIRVDVLGRESLQFTSSNSQHEYFQVLS